jgi:hypothetical protein
MLKPEQTGDKTMLRSLMIGLAFAGGLMLNALPAPEAPLGLRLQLAAEASAQMNEALFRQCRRAVRRSYRAPGCTRRCYPRRFYDSNVDLCVMNGGRI